MSANYSWYNGKIDHSENIHISPNDLGLLRGYGLFDYFRTYNRKPFKWDWYWNRFSNSAKLLNIPINISQTKAAEILSELTALTETPEMAFRFLLTGGDASDSSTMTSPNLLIRSEPIVQMAAEVYEKGISVITHAYTRDMPEIKTTDYKRLLSLATDIKNAGAIDVLFHENGQLSEMSRSNIFVIKEGLIKTPDTGILKGITRRTVMELSVADFEVKETKVSLKELFEADEVFTTSSNKKVLAITKIDQQIIGNGAVGPISLELLNRFNALTEHW